MFIWKLSAVWKYVECFHAHYLFDKNNKTKKYWTTYHTLLFVMLVISVKTCSVLVPHGKPASWYLLF